MSARTSLSDEAETHIVAGINAEKSGQHVVNKLVNVRYNAVLDQHWRLTEVQAERLEERNKVFVWRGENKEG